MQGYLAVLTLALLVILVVSRIILMGKLGIKAMRFGEMDKKDFLIPPFALIYFYLVSVPGRLNPASTAYQ